MNDVKKRVLLSSNTFVSCYLGTGFYLDLRPGKVEDKELSVDLIEKLARVPNVKIQIIEDVKPAIDSLPKKAPADVVKTIKAIEAKASEEIKKTEEPKSAEELKVPIKAVEVKKPEEVKQTIKPAPAALKTDDKVLTKKDLIDKAKLLKIDVAGLSKEEILKKIEESEKSA